jgi:hypothetical protein
VLDDVERWRFLVQPAGEYSCPAFVGALDVDLDEGASQFLDLPRRRRLAGPQADDHVLPPRRLTGVKRDVLDDAVALVEDAEHRDALRHWRHAALASGGRRDLASGRRRRVLRLIALAARNERERSQQRGGSCPHAYSGIQGS